ncbi:MAG: hypothetical protein O3C40_20550 [Planctomycetota bacterium]|nr:hypothetical protein [Planctomycetota bacterium]
MYRARKEYVDNAAIRLKIPRNASLRDRLEDLLRLSREVCFCRDRAACIVVARSEPSSLRTHGPLLDFFRDNFEPVPARGTTEIWQRRHAPPDLEVVASREM